MLLQAGLLAGTDQQVHISPSKEDTVEMDRELEASNVSEAESLGPVNINLVTEGHRCRQVLQEDEWRERRGRKVFTAWEPRSALGEEESPEKGKGHREPERRLWPPRYPELILTALPTRLGKNSPCGQSSIT